MKDKNLHIKELKKYRIEKAKETLNAARLLINQGYYTSAVNRLYYACFYIVNAMFLDDGVSAKSHNGVRALLGKNYILTKRLPVKMGEIFNDMFENRQSGDYDDIFDFEKQKTEELFDDASYFVHTIIQLLNNKEQS